MKKEKPEALVMKESKPAANKKTTSTKKPWAARHRDQIK
jgi:hypothetical protein